MSKPRIVSLDIGNGFTKAMSSTNRISFASVIATEQGAIDFGGFNPNHDFVIELEGTRYALGETAWKLGRMRVTAMDRSRVGTPFYKVLLAGALAAVSQQSGTVSVILSLPVAWYSSREAVKGELSGTYSVGYAGKTYTYQVEREFMRILPEGFGTVSCMVLNQSGGWANRQLADRRIGVVDIGTKTTDFMYFRSLEIYPAKSGGIDSALADVWRLVSEDISKHVGRNLELHEIDEALHNGYFTQSGKRVDIKAWKDKALKSLASAVSGEIASLWAGGSQVDNILLTGGGAEFVYPYLDFEHKFLIDDGYMANCEGAYRYGLFRAAASVKEQLGDG